jgi:hypothetical protein
MINTSDMDFCIYRAHASRPTQICSNCVIYRVPFFVYGA